MSEVKRAAAARMAGELRRLQDELQEVWIDRSLPEGWHGLDDREPLPPVREKVTLRLDADMLRWFRKLGPGYGRRINSILRIYWEGLVSGRVQAHAGEDEVTPQFLDWLSAKAGEDVAAE
ncbi:BrnA antitoxin family protein [Rhodalgimonas zhirmunskyi]|uniref:BrnA antitoxin family protein n=1 Tax=Rhodalgimonas zhirmunskyi TaxID=2964767 RepID=A0AAJ1UCG6_9RHOB|nr:BrnA antitoxin family protein [Rhodoalgimonas zhirmunskyi]MDQ2095353.1 BrnA antitoxin family protein [Rhodoalgimonas zhirmunskyi]